MHLGFHNLGLKLETSIINTVLNVQGNTKDNLKSRLDLPDICSCKELYVMANGKGHVHVFGLDASRKQEFFD